MRRAGVLLLCLALPACQSVTMVKMRQAPTIDDITTAVGLKSPSAETQATLAKHGAAGLDKGDAITVLSKLPPEAIDADVLVARAELSLLYAPVATRPVSIPKIMWGWYAGAVRDSYEALEHPTASPETLARAARIYNVSCERFLKVTSRGPLKLDAQWMGDCNVNTVHVSREASPDLWEPDRFSEYLDVDDYRVTGIAHRHRTDGLGVRLMGLRERGAETGGPQAKFTPGRQCNAVTAILRPYGPSLVLELHDPLRRDRVKIGDRTAPLAADFTAPLCYQIMHSDLAWIEQLGMFDPLKQEDHSGIYVLHPYQRGKIPVVFVHGLWSSPRAWTEAINDLQADPVLREKYQFWVFFYPTGNPFIKSAAKLRQSLRDVRQAFDPSGTDPAFDQMVMVGHSMGGLLTKAMVSGSGDDMWKAIANGPFDQLVAPADERDAIKQVFFYDPQPCIKRAVFVATPHRGSWFGNSTLGRLGDRLIHLPHRIRGGLSSLVQANPPGYFTETYKGGMPSSIDLLEWHNPLLSAMDRRPAAPGVVCHSIIGQLLPGKLEDSTDGVVTYSSSHVDGVRSEKVIRDGHNCTGHPDTIAELRRILREAD